MKKSNFYLFYGDDKSLIDNEIDKLKKSLGILGDTIYYNMNMDSISDIVVEASTVGMFTTDKFIVIDGTLYFNSKGDMDVSSLEDYLNNYNVNSYLVFTSDGGNIDSRKKLVKLISSKGIMKKFDTSNDYLNDFVRDYLKDNGYVMDNVTISYFLGRCNLSVSDIKNELDKLMLYKLEDKKITLDDVSLLVEEKIDDTIFELVSSILKNDTDKAMKLYYNFLDNGMDVSQIIAVIASQIRLLFQVKRLSNSGKSNDEIAKILEFKSVYRVKYLLSDAYYYSERDLLKYLHKLADIDASIKKGNLDGKVLLELFIAKKDM